MFIRYVVVPKKPAEQIDPKVLKKLLEDLHEARKPKTCGPGK